MEASWLFKRRDNALHFSEDLRDTVIHPLGIPLAPEYRNYSVESAERALNLVLEILSTCMTHPKPGNSPLIAYVSGMSGSLEDVERQRAELSNQDNATESR